MKGWAAPASARRDPGRTTGSTAGYAPLPRCEVPCHHLGEGHVIDARKPHGRGACNAADPHPCPCKVYTPEETSDGR